MPSAAGVPHIVHLLPHSGWVSYPIRGERAVPGAIDLFRLAYERARARQGAAAPGQPRRFAEEETKPVRAS